MKKNKKFCDGCCYRVHCDHEIEKCCYLIGRRCIIKDSYDEGDSD